MITMKLIVLIGFLCYSSLYGMKGRLIGFSEDKKIFLLNRGKEDGVEEGMHATFHTTEKKIFRAEVLRLSPARSIWQIYRLYDESILRENYVLEVKKASIVEKI